MGREGSNSSTRDRRDCGRKDGAGAGLPADTCSCQRSRELRRGAACTTSADPAQGPAFRRRRQRHAGGDVRTAPDHGTASTSTVATATTAGDGPRPPAAANALSTSNGGVTPKPSRFAKHRPQRVRAVHRPEFHFDRHCWRGRSIPGPLMGRPSMRGPARRAHPALSSRRPMFSRSARPAAAPALEARNGLSAAARDRGRRMRSTSATKSRSAHVVANLPYNAHAILIRWLADRGRRGGAPSP